MKKGAKRLLFWMPRILGLLLAVFVSIFAVDVFGAGNGFWKTVVALGFHLVPTALILIALAISWRRPWAGAILFAMLGGLYLVLFWGRFPASVYLIICGLLFVVAILFLAGWLSRVEQPAKGAYENGP